MAIAVDLMGGEIDAEALLLLCHPFGQRPCGGGRHPDRHDIRLAAEQAALSADARVGGAGGMGEDRLRGCVPSGSIGGDRIAGAAATQAFALSVAEAARFDPLVEVV